MSIKKVIQRLLFLVLVIWAASTITFFIPRLSSKNPVRERFNQLAMSGGFNPEDMDVIIASYNAKFGLDKPLLQQYWDYVSGIARLDLGVSFNKFPRTVMQLIMDSLPWTIALLLVTTVLSFVMGNLLGAVFVVREVVGKQAALFQNRSNFFRIQGERILNGLQALGGLITAH